MQPTDPGEAAMPTLAEACGDAVAFTYRSLDRLILNAYIPTLQMAGAMVTFLREVQSKPILSPVVFKALTDRFVTAVHAFTEAHRIPVLHATGRTKPGAVAQRALHAAARAHRWGVVAVVVHQESARVFTSRHAGGRRTNFWVREERRLVNHYYFYLRDREYGDGFVRISSYAPFQMRIWLNAHGYLAAQLRRRRVPFRTVDNCVVEVADPAVLATIADGFDAALVEQIARRWLAWVPDPLTPAERAAGYPTYLSIYQAEFSDNVIFHRTQVLNRVYEDLLRDHLHLGRPDMLKVVFDRQIRRTTPSTFKTRVLRQGVVSCLKVFYKKSFLKQYNKAGLVLRTEVCVNDPRDFSIGRSLVHLGYLGTIAYHAITRFLKAQTVALATALDRSTFERLITASHEGGHYVAGLRLGAPQVMRLLAALGCAGLTFRAFSQTDLRTLLVDRFGAEPTEVTPARLSYQLTKLRGKGLVRKVPRRNRYTLTDRGYRVTLYLTKLHQRLLSPTLDSLDAALRPALLASSHRLDHALAHLNADLDQIAELSGLKLTA
jgi:DNA-binding transcriptional ArsR family regulator